MSHMTFKNQLKTYEMMHKRKIIFILFGSIALILFCFLNKVFWLGYIIFFFAAVYLLFASQNRIHRFIYKHKWIKYSFGFLSIMAFAISLRLLVFEVYSIPTSSMENTIFTDDVVIVNKLSLGPRLPQSPFEIPWINILFYLNHSSREKIDSIWWESKRLPGFNKIANNDIVIFNRSNKDVAYLKRCVAIPGDTLSIEKSLVLINGVKQFVKQNVKLRYRLYTSDFDSLHALLNSMEILYSKLKENEYSIILDNQQFHRLEAYPAIDSIKEYLANYGGIYRSFVRGEDLKWSIDCFGPLVIPKKGMKIALNYQNYLKYMKAIQQGERIDIEYENGAVVINGKIEEHYIFKNNYYFMMGDNRYDSRDSRYVGMIPENRIIGRTKRILFSTHNNIFQWNRLFKRLI